MATLISFKREYVATKQSEEVSKIRGSIKNQRKYAKFDFHPEGYVATKKSEEVPKIRGSMPNLFFIQREYARTKNWRKYPKFAFNSEEVCCN